MYGQCTYMKKGVALPCLQDYPTASPQYLGQSAVTSRVTPVRAKRESQPRNVNITLT